MDPKNWTPLVGVEYRIRKKVQDAKGTQDLYCRVQNNVGLELIAGKKNGDVPGLSHSIYNYYSQRPKAGQLGQARK